MMRRRWKFAVEKDDGHGYLTKDGHYTRSASAVEDWIGTTIQADAEASRRANAFEDLTGTISTLIVPESQGRVQP